MGLLLKLRLGMFFDFATLMGGSAHENMDPSLAVGENVHSRRGLYCLAAKKTKFRQPTAKKYNRNFGAEAGIDVVSSFDV